MNEYGWYHIPGAPVPPVLIAVEVHEARPAMNGEFFTFMQGGVGVGIHGNFEHGLGEIDVLTGL
jgi:hypothetical protein